MRTNNTLNPWMVARRQVIVLLMVMIPLAGTLTILYFNDRHQEWALRVEQSQFRLDRCSDLIGRYMREIRSDILFVANQHNVRSFSSTNGESTQVVEHDFSNFLEQKGNYQQVRLVDLNGREAVRVDRTSIAIRIVPANELQDKQDRYYIQESKKLKTGEVFVSDFDLNQEHGVIETPPNPVIRLVTPVADMHGNVEYLLVINYRGTSLLNELATASSPARTYLLRSDGEFLLGPEQQDAWGWQLGHDCTFARQFPDAWSLQGINHQNHLTRQGGFAFRRISLQSFSLVNQAGDDQKTDGRINELLIVTHITPGLVFETSHQLLQRLWTLGSFLLIPLLLVTRVWALNAVRRDQQNKTIFDSEKKLRELSSRLVGIQEEERCALSREIHDQLGQQATAISLDLQLAEREDLSEAGRTQIRRAIDEIEQLLATLHDFASRIRPVVLDDLGLQAAVEAHVWQFENRTGIPVKLEFRFDNIDFPQTVAENVFRLVQESLNNVAKHAKATAATVSIQHKTDKRNSQLMVQITDNGIGTNVQSTNLHESHSRLGILGMQERVGLLGGTFEFKSTDRLGTSIDICIPLDAENNQE